MQLSYEELLKMKTEIFSMVAPPAAFGAEEVVLSIKVKLEADEYTKPTRWRLIGAKGKAQNIVSLCQKNGLNPVKVLEVGAGDGAILAHLDKMSFCRELHALDVSVSSEKVIRGLNLKSLQRAATFDGYNIPYGDNEFDLLILSHVLEHVEYERILLREIQRVSKFQIIEVPLDFHSYVDLNWLKCTAYGHINIYTPPILRYLLRSELFYIVDDILGRYSFEVMEYLHFDYNTHQRTPEEQKRFRINFSNEQSRFDSLTREEQEKCALWYAVLTKKITSDELFEEIIALANHLQQQGLDGDAKLVLKNIEKYSLGRLLESKLK